jgi:aspartate carbamoyltransferase catalytic subunit
LRNLLSAGDLDKQQAISILDLAHEMDEVNDREIKKLPTLRGKTVVNLFFEDSTRTRISFELAAKRLSADVISFSAKGSSASKGESLKDTAQTLEAMGADVIVLRHSASGTHEHPTQALLDAMTIRQSVHSKPRGCDLSGIRVLIVGDIAHSRVARSNLILLRLLGAEVAICGPATIAPGSLNQGASSFSLLDAALDEFQPDVVMMLRVQQERMSSSYFPTEREYAKFWGLNHLRLAKLSPNAIILHPGPMNRGLEIDAAAADSARSRVLQQVKNGISIRMAVLFSILTGDKRT